MEQAVSPPLKEELYNLQPQEIEFFKQQTGIQDDDELKRHIIDVQKEAYAVFPYTCIRRFGFTVLKISRFPAYQELLRLGKERPGALFLDIGCCFGNDIRKAVADGFPVNQAIGSDLRQQFWDLGYKLFKDTPESFPVPFIQGDVFDPAFLSPTPSAPPDTPLPPLHSLKTLTPLHGRLSIIHASAFFHLFNEEQQHTLASRLALLLSPEPGSFIFGAHGGRTEKGFRTEDRFGRKREIPMFCHSPESWTELWEKDIFKEGEVKVWTRLIETKRPEPGESSPGVSHLMLAWSVTRL
ncbi:hypothetical protein C8Q75DRAFT_712487 [Abortiporus biennis]|nr:hypothetical protein C8Q75DRAFT_712487 [Abortiporus biennis]